MVAIWGFMPQALWPYQLRTLQSPLESEEADVTLGCEDTNGTTQTFWASIWPAPVLWTSRKIKRPLWISGTFAESVLNFSKPPYLCFLLAEIWKPAKNPVKASILNEKVYRVGPSSLLTCQECFWVLLWTVKFNCLCFWEKCLWGPLSGSEQSISEHLWGRTDFCFKSIVDQYFGK